MSNFIPYTHLCKRNGASTDRLDQMIEVVDVLVNAKCWCADNSIMSVWIKTPNYSKDKLYRNNDNGAGIRFASKDDAVFFKMAYL